MRLKIHLPRRLTVSKYLGWLRFIEQLDSGEGLRASGNAGDIPTAAPVVRIVRIARKKSAECSNPRSMASPPNTETGKLTRCIVACQGAL
jgi:hypothetical protein